MMGTMLVFNPDRILLRSLATIPKPRGRPRQALLGFGYLVALFQPL